MSFGKFKYSPNILFFEEQHNISWVVFMSQPTGWPIQTKSSQKLKGLYTWFEKIWEKLSTEAANEQFDVWKPVGWLILRN